MLILRDDKHNRVSIASNAMSKDDLISELFIIDFVTSKYDEFSAIRGGFTGANRSVVLDGVDYEVYSELLEGLTHSRVR